MEAKFIGSNDVARESMGDYRIGWHSRPAANGARQLVVVEVAMQSGAGHDFHRHPDQEEVIYVTGGAIEQWLDTERRVLRAGESASIPPGMVHASFNDGPDEATFIAMLAPCVGDEGYVLEEMHQQQPWSELRARD